MENVFLSGLWWTIEIGHNVDVVVQ